MDTRLDSEALDAVAAAVASSAVVDRFWSHVLVQPTVSTCRWWHGAISNAGHGRFWIGQGRVVIAHRFAWAIAFGADALSAAPVLAHDCDNPLCVNVEHTQPATVAENTAEWARRRKHWAGPLADPRGTRARAWAIRDGLREGRSLATLLEESKSQLERGQLALW